MFVKVLRAVRIDLCQADEDELLVPNPVVLPGQDNDFFVGIHSRRPARFGRLLAVETLDARYIVEADQAAVNGAGGDEAPDEERVEDVEFFIDALSDFDVGALVGCRYTFEGDEVSWEIFEVEEDTLTEK